MTTSRYRVRSLLQGGKPIVVLDDQRSRRVLFVTRRSDGALLYRDAHRAYAAFDRGGQIPPGKLVTDPAMWQLSDTALREAGAGVFRWSQDEDSDWESTFDQVNAARRDVQGEAA